MFGSTDAGIFTSVGFLVISSVVIATLSVPESVRTKQPDPGDPAVQKS